MNNSNYGGRAKSSFKRWYQKVGWDSTEPERLVCWWQCNICALESPSLAALERNFWKGSKPLQHSRSDSGIQGGNE